MPRSFEREILDDGDYTQAEYETCLQQLNKINHLTMGYTPTLRAIARAAQLTTERPLKILDIGFGRGDTLREIAAWAAKKNLAVELHGVELNSRATDVAQRLTPPQLEIQFQTRDLYTLGDDERFHLVTCALMAHHLTDSEIEKMLGWMTRHSTVAWFINDLHRHWLAHALIKIIARVAGFNRMIQHDGPLSVKRAFVRSEWLTLIRASGLNLSRATIRWWWSFRYGVFYRVV